VIAPHHKLTLSDGRVVSLESLRQWLVYAGLLEGLPTREQNDAEIAALVAKARADDRHDPLLIPPAQRPIAYEGRYPFGEPACLPPVACVARLRSHKPARDMGMDCSDLTVIWFQDDYAFPLSAEAEQSIMAIDWAKLARDDQY
jgi:hypothetical protein